MVEQKTLNLLVGGSSPPRVTSVAGLMIRGDYFASAPKRKRTIASRSFFRESGSAIERP